MCAMSNQGTGSFGSGSYELHVMLRNNCVIHMSRSKTQWASTWSYRKFPEMAFKSIPNVYLEAQKLPSVQQHLPIEPYFQSYVIGATGKRMVAALYKCVDTTKVVALNLNCRLSERV